MKILVLQLTRPGDIFCTVPTLSALRRKYPEVEIHLLVRKRFAQSAQVAKVYDHLWQMDAQKLLGEFITGDKSVPEGLTRLSGFIQELRAEKFDSIINLSFSPSSSFLAHLISEGSRIPVRGYTRTSDFYLSIPDHGSEYFKAQCGLDKSNRRHVVDLLAEIAGVAVQESDVHLLAPQEVIERRGVVCHLGASQDQKTWPLLSWLNFLNSALNSYSGSVTLIGAKEDHTKAVNLLTQIDSLRIVNKVGETSWVELAGILQTSELFVGADSGPLHMASLCGCPSLNLSVGDVRFWETGPTVPNSRVLRSKNPSYLMSEVVLFHFLDMLAKLNNIEGSAVCQSDGLLRYAPTVSANLDTDAWPLVHEMYFQGSKPLLSGELTEALIQISEVVEIALTQLTLLEKNPEKSAVVGILDRLDEVLEILRTTILPLTPLLDEFKTRKENIPPGPRPKFFFGPGNATSACMSE